MRITLQFVDLANQSVSFTALARRIISVGRGPWVDCTVPASAIHVSRRHFLLELTPPDCRVIDLGARNKTFLNGRPIRAANIRHGDIISAADTAIRIQIEATDEQTASQVLTMDEVVQWQEDQFRAGHRQLVERTLDQWPDLREQTERVLELIYHEFLLRQPTGDGVAEEEYIGRFPHLQRMIQEQFDCHRLFFERSRHGN